MGKVKGNVKDPIKTEKENSVCLCTRKNGFNSVVELPRIV